MSLGETSSLFGILSQLESHRIGFTIMRVLVSHSARSLMALLAIQATLSGGAEHPLSNNVLRQSEAHDRQIIEFKAQAFFNGRSKNGVRFCRNFYSSSDGVGVSQILETYASAARAKAELKKRVHRARKIIEQSVKSAQNGETVQRVVLLFPAARRRKSSAAILWTEGAVLYAIESTSLEHALMFERGGQ